MNQSQYQTGWVPEPSVNERGTASIIYTCFFTIYACTWTALHLNIPRRSLSQFARLIRKVQWMILAVLAPEYISVTALVQRSSTISALAQGWPLNERSRPLAYYALMGGFELHFDDETYHRLKYSELRGLVLAGFADAPDITSEEVTDKSKGSWFTKSLALLQIGWFVLQLLGRVAQKLQTTPLELFTLGAVACTVVSYINWWAKPLDVNTSTPVSMASKRRISKQAFFAPLEKYRLEVGGSSSKVDHWLEGLRTFVPLSLSHRISEQQADSKLAAAFQIGSYDDRHLPIYLGLHLQKAPQDVIRLLDGQHLLTTSDFANWEIYRDGIAALRSIDRAVSRIDIDRWGRRRDLFNVFGTKRSRPRNAGQRPEGFWSDAFFEDRAIHTSSFLGLAFTTLVFGACHLLAWNFGFPSSAERILWRVMSIACTLIPMILLIVDMSPDWIRKMETGTRTTLLEKEDRSSPPQQALEKHMNPTADRIAVLLTAGWRAIMATLTSYTSSQIVLLLYLVLRVYLVAAIFASLRAVPPSVYLTVDWSRYIPHFG